VGISSKFSWLSSLSGRKSFLYSGLLGPFEGPSVWAAAELLLKLLIGDRGPLL